MPYYEDREALENEAIRKEPDQVTLILCDVCKELEKASLLDSMICKVQGLGHWVLTHQLLNNLTEWRGEYRAIDNNKKHLYYLNVNSRLMLNLAQGVFIHDSIDINLAEYVTPGLYCKE